MTKHTRIASTAEAEHRLSVAVARVSAAATLARAVADHVPEGGDGDKLDCLDAIELHLLRPAVAELRDAHEKASAGLAG